MSSTEPRADLAVQPSDVVDWVARRVWAGDSPAANGGADLQPKRSRS